MFNEHLLPYMVGYIKKDIWSTNLSEKYLWEQKKPTSKAPYNRVFVFKFILAYLDSYSDQWEFGNFINSML